MPKLKVIQLIQLEKAIQNQKKHLIKSYILKTRAWAMFLNDGKFGAQYLKCILAKSE